MNSPQCYSYLRFSSPDQLKSDSERRQTDLSDAYAARLRLPVNTDLNLKDLGISAFKGKHGNQGALGIFLKLVEDNKIAEGSYLLIEKFDRLTREHPFDTFELLGSILKKGITVVTLDDGMEYSGKPGLDKLVVKLAKAALAHEESVKKSKRFSAKWEEKRNQINNEKLTGRCPDWLTLNKEKTKFTKMADRCKIVRFIFEKNAAGMNAEAIALLLNKKETPFWPLKGGWRKRYIQKILRNRAVLGEFQPHVVRTYQPDGTERKKKKREPVGEPILNYYPAIISKELFYKVQEQIDRNKGRGCKTGVVSNLFSTLAKCGYCEGPMRIINKGKPPKGEKSLACDNAARGLGCIYKSVRYLEVENLIIRYCQGLRPTDILDDRSETTAEIAMLESERVSIQGQLNELETKIANLLSALETAPTDSLVHAGITEKLQERYNEREKLRKNLATIFNQLGTMEQVETNTEHQLITINELVDRLEKSNGEELVDLRLRLRNELRKLINNITIYTVGTHRHFIQTAIEVKPKNISPQHLRKMEAKLSKGFYDMPEQRTYIIEFKTGNERMLQPAGELKLMSEFDKETGRTVEVFINHNGLSDVDMSYVGEQEHKPR